MEGGKVKISLWHTQGGTNRLSLKSKRFLKIK